MFVGAGISRGNLDWNERASKRRREIAQAFETFKQNNPYATADDFNNYIETLIGPEEYYLRGNVPAQGVINQLANDNAKRKEQDERTRALEAAANEMRVTSAMQEMAYQMLPTHSDEKIIESMLQYMPGDDPETREKNRQRLSSTLNLSGMRHKMQQEAAARAAAQARQDAERKQKAFARYMDNLINVAPNMADMMGTPEGMELLKSTMQASAYAAGVDWDEKLENHSMNYINSMRNAKLGARHPALVDQYKTELTGRQEKMAQIQEAQMAQSAGATEDPVKNAAIGYANARYAFQSPEAIAKFNQFVHAYDTDEGMAPSKIAEDFFNEYKDSGMVAEKSNMDAFISEQSSRYIQKPATLSTYIAESEDQLREIDKTVEARIAASRKKVQQTQSITDLDKEIQQIQQNRQRLENDIVSAKQGVRQDAASAQNWLIVEDYSDIIQPAAIPQAVDPMIDRMHKRRTQDLDNLLDEAIARRDQLKELARKREREGPQPRTPRNPDTDFIAP